MKCFIKVLILPLCAILMQAGCTSLQTFPVAARAGDTVSLAVGSYDNMTKDNITVEFLPDGVLPGNGTALTPRAVFRLYADQTSIAYQNPTYLLGGVSGKSGHAPWLNVLVIDLPSSLNTTTTPINGQIYVNRLGGTGTPPVYPGHGTDLQDFWDDPAISSSAENNIKIALTVLPTGLASTGTGASDLFRYELGGGYDGGGLLTPGSAVNGSLGTLSPVEHCVVAPPFDGDPSSVYSNATYGAVEIVLTLAVETNTGTPVALDPVTNAGTIRVVADDMDSYTLSHRAVSYGLTATNQLKVMMVSPQGKLKYFEPRISVLLNPLANLTWTSVPTISSVTYYDKNGVPVVPPSVPSNIEYISEYRGG
jgi:hypothetical protein